MGTTLSTTLDEARQTALMQVCHGSLAGVVSIAKSAWGNPTQEGTSS